MTNAFMRTYSKLCRSRVIVIFIWALMCSHMHTCITQGGVLDICKLVLSSKTCTRQLLATP